MTELIKAKDLDQSMIEYLGYKNAEDVGDVLLWSTKTFIEKDSSDGKIVIHGITTDPSEDLHGEAMSKDFVTTMVKQAQKAIRKKKYFPQFSNHDFRWQNMISYMFKAWEDNNQFHYRSVPNMEHPLAKTLINMLRDGAPIENSIVIAKVRIEEKQHPESKKVIPHIVDGIIKSADFVGIGANERTSVNIEKSFDNVHGSENMTEPGHLELNLQENKDSSNKGESEVKDQVSPDHDKIKELEEKFKTFSTETTKALKEAAENALKEVLKGIKDDFKKEYESLVTQKVASLITERSQKALVKAAEGNENNTSTEDILRSIDRITSEKDLEDIMSSAMKVADKKRMENKK